MSFDFVDVFSPNHDHRRASAAIDMLVLHYTGMVDAASALERLCDRQAKVSAHYMIDEDGTPYRLVAEENRAWHAGASYWDGETDINSCSIGIELVNPGHAYPGYEGGYRSFPPAQMKTLIDLCREIIARHPIAASRVLGHSDVAPKRKQDPGELFDWVALAHDGIGLWPHILPEDESGEQDSTMLLKRFGYETGDAETDQASLFAFQRHFQTETLTGLADTETLRRLRALCRQKILL